MAEQPITWHELIEELNTGTRTATTPLGHDTTAYYIASLIHERMGRNPQDVFEQYGLTAPEAQAAIQHEYDRIVLAWEKAAQRENRYGTDRDVNH